jgi:2-hydroxychromene-2-carboxylate isomerase
MARVEFFYDLSSPWTHMAFANIQPILAETGASVAWRPFLVGGVFNAVNPGLYESRAPHHPLRSVVAMRFCCALEDSQIALHRFSEAAFDAYFRDQRNLDDPAELIAVADACGLDGKALGERAVSQPVKDRLRENTQEAIDRGAYGSPTIFVDRDYMYFGNDQLPLVQQRLETGAGL